MRATERPRPTVASQDAHLTAPATSDAGNAVGMNERNAMNDE